MLGCVSASHCEVFDDENVRAIEERCYNRSSTEECCSGLIGFFRSEWTAWQTCPAKPDKAGRTCHVAAHHGISRNEKVERAPSTVTSLSNINQLQGYLKILLHCECFDYVYERSYPFLAD